MSGGGYLPNQNREAGQNGAVMAPCSGLQLQQTVQVATEQVELGGLEVLGRLHGTPDALWDLQEELNLGGHGVELFLPLPLALQQDDTDTLHIYTEQTLDNVCTEINVRETSNNMRIIGVSTRRCGDRQ